MLPAVQLTVGLAQRLKKLVSVNSDNRHRAAPPSSLAVAGDLRLQPRLAARAI